MSQPKPLASLNAGLLARKGAARPAMRPPVYPPLPASQVELLRDIARPSAAWPDEADWRDPAEADLGWNDMGEDASVAPISLAPIAAEIALPAEKPADKPTVRLDQEALAERIAAKIDGQTPRRSALSEGRRAAFTLRVDAARHLKLRLACTIGNRSAQQLVTDALDQLLDTLPEVAALAAQVNSRR